MYPLEDRTYEFSKSVVFACKKIPQNNINKNIFNQLVRSATSVGANYCEANGVISRSDFRNKIHICKKEAQESHYWLKLLGDCTEPKSSDIERLIVESKELTLIFGKITSTMKTSKEKFNNKK